MDDDFYSTRRYSKAWRAQKENDKWKPSKALASGREGYLREFDWHCAIELEVMVGWVGGSIPGSGGSVLDRHWGKRANSDSMGFERVTALVVPTAWMSASLAAVQTKPRRWEAVLEKVAEICCKRFESVANRSRMGHDAKLAGLLARAVAKDGSWLASVAGFPGTYALRIAPLDSPRERLGGLGVSLELPIFKDERSARAGLARVQERLADFFGAAAEIHCLGFGDEPYRPTQNQWHARSVAMEIRGGLSEPSADACPVVVASRPRL